MLNYSLLGERLDWINMEWWQGIILGLLQGVMEVLPISSTAHLVLFHNLMGMEESTLSLDVMLNFGSWIAVMWFFRDVWLDMVVGVLNFIKIQGSLITQKSPRSWIRKISWFQDMTVKYEKNTFYYQNLHQVYLFLYLIIGTIPAGLIGLIFRDYIDQVLRTPFFVSLALIFGGGLLWLSDVFGRQSQSLADMRWWQSMIVGVGQVLALIPGFSRSGATITAGLFSGFTRSEAATFSFLLGAPLVLGAAVVELPDFITTYEFSFPSLSAFFISIITTYVTLKAFYHIIERQSYLVFVIYRIILGVVLLGFIAI